MANQTLMTADEFEAVAHQLGPCELVRGEVITLSPGGFAHSRHTAVLAFLLGRWESQTRLGRVLTCEMGVVVEQDPDTVRGGDVVYYSYERLPREATPEGFCRVPPNLIVEIVGKGQGWRAMVRKTSEYLAMGVDRVWVVDPQTRRVHIFRPDAEPIILSGDDTLTDETVLPGFTRKISDLFAT